MLPPGRLDVTPSSSITTCSCTEEAVGQVAAMAEHPQLDPSTRRIMVTGASCWTRCRRRARVALRNWRSLVYEALLALIAATTWSEVVRVFAQYANELSGDLAIEILAKLRSAGGRTAAERDPGSPRPSPGIGMGARDREGHCGYSTNATA